MNQYRKESRVLLIGGPADGRRIIVEGNPPTRQSVEVVEWDARQSNRLLSDANADPLKATMPHHLYKLERLRSVSRETGRHTEYYVYMHDSLDDVVSALIDGYKAEGGSEPGGFPPCAGLRRRFVSGSALARFGPGAVRPWRGSALARFGPGAVRVCTVCTVCRFAGLPVCRFAATH